MQCLSVGKGDVESGQAQATSRLIKRSHLFFLEENRMGTIVHLANRGHYENFSAQAIFIKWQNDEDWRARKRANRTVST